jgi:hypothetical protein
VNGSFQLHNIGIAGSQLNWTINLSSITWGTWTYSPESGKNLTPEDGFITVHVSVRAPDQQNTKFEGYIRVENQNKPNDNELIPVTLKTPTDTKNSLTTTSLIQFILHHFPLISSVLFLRTILKNIGFLLK